LLDQNITLDEVEAFVFDFDGVLTNNFVYVSEDGKESVRCSRADGIAFDALRKLEKTSYILSSEKNSVVTKRANKLGITAIQGKRDKLAAIKELIKKKNLDINRIVYVGNDLNDLQVMKKLKLTMCPKDSHPRVQAVALFVLKTKGGEGIVREILEAVFNLNIEDLLYNGA
tara:strand:- start:1069 stop:1581 length:513 start_codon:yes stop_codon:yes gene_type:complete